MQRKKERGRSCIMHLRRSRKSRTVKTICVVREEDCYRYTLVCVVKRHTRRNAHAARHGSPRCASSPRGNGSSLTRREPSGSSPWSSRRMPSGAKGRRRPKGHRRALGHDPRAERPQPTSGNGMTQNGGAVSISLHAIACRPCVVAPPAGAMFMLGRFVASPRIRLVTDRPRNDPVTRTPVT